LKTLVLANNDRVGKGYACHDVSFPVHFNSIPGRLYQATRSHTTYFGWA